MSDIPPNPLPGHKMPHEDYLNATYGIRSWLLTTDHKRIALLYLGSVTVFFFIGGIFATMIRIHLLTPTGALVTPETYNKLFTMHGVAMIFFFLIPSIPAVLGNFLIPLMIGAKDLAFPKINLLSWYIYMIGGCFVLYSFSTGGLDTGWAFFTPLSSIYSNSSLTPAVIGIFFNWFYSHPAVYIMVLPAMGVVSEIIPTFARKPIFGYSFIAGSSIAIAVIGFLVWAHHMFVTGESTYAALTFSFLSYLVAIPSAVKVFNWTSTLYKGSISWDTPMLYAFGFIGLFLIGGLTGLFLACLGLDIHIHDTYFVVAHFHYIMVGGAVMGYVGGIHFWWPKITGRLYPEALSRAAAVTLFFGFNLTFFPQFILGSLGMPRRYHTYPPEFQVLNVLSTAGASILALGYLLPMIYLTWSMRYGKVAGKNPWPATGLEWTTDSPPPTENFHVTPEVTWEPYDYLNRPDLGLTAGSTLPAPAHGDD